jgi:hypothetical protein
MVLSAIASFRLWRRISSWFGGALEDALPEADEPPDDSVQRSHVKLLGCSLGFGSPLGLLFGGVFLFGLDEGVVTSDEDTIRPDYLISCFPEVSVG